MLDGTQDNRLGELVTPSTTDPLLLPAFSARESLGLPLEIAIDCLPQDDSLNVGRLIGQTCSVELKRDNGGVRHLSEICVESDRQGGRTARGDALRPFPRAHLDQKAKYLLRLTAEALLAGRVAELRR